MMVELESRNVGNVPVVAVYSDTEPVVDPRSITAEKKTGISDIVPETDHVVDPDVVLNSKFVPETKTEIPSFVPCFSF
jgi:hypothetical protein